MIVETGQFALILALAVVVVCLFAPVSATLHPVASSLTRKVKTPV